MLQDKVSSLVSAAEELEETIKEQSQKLDEDEQRIAAFLEERDQLEFRSVLSLPFFLFGIRTSLSFLPFPLTDLKQHLRSMKSTVWTAKLVN